jgi:small GTP-binding protein
LYSSIARRFLSGSNFCFPFVAFIVLFRFETKKSLMQQQNEDELRFKLLVLGDANAGKRSLVRRYVHGIFYHSTRPTVGVDICSKTVTHHNRPVTLQLWEVAVADRFPVMSPAVCRESAGAFIVADITNRVRGLQVAESWKKALDVRVWIPATLEPLPVILLLNKCELGRCELTDAQLDEWCAKHKFKGWLAVSAQDGTNVNEAFERMITLMIEATAPQAERATSSAPTRWDQLRNSAASLLGYGVSQLYRLLSIRRTSKSEGD